MTGERTAPGVTERRVTTEELSSPLAPHLTIHLTPHLEGRIGRRGEQAWKLLLPCRSAPTTGRHSGHDVAGCEIVHNGRSSWTLMAVDMSTLPPKAGRTADSHTSHMTAMTMTSSTCIPSSDPMTDHLSHRVPGTTYLTDARSRSVPCSLLTLLGGAEWGLSPDHDLSILQLCSEAGADPTASRRPLLLRLLFRRGGLVH